MPPRRTAQLLRVATAQDSQSDAGTIDSKEEEEHKELPEDRLHRALEQLGEKRGATKLMGLNTLIETLANTYSVEFVSRLSETMTEALFRIVKKGEPDAGVKAVRGLCVLAITLGNEGIGAAGVFMNCWKDLDALSRDVSKTIKARIAAVEGIAMLCFLGAREPDDEEKCYAMFEDLYRTGLRETQDPVTFDLITEALDGYGLLLTAEPGWKLCAPSMDAHVATWTLLLEHPSLEVRSSAGENIALVYEARFRKAVEDEELGVQSPQTNSPELGGIIEKVQGLVRDANRRTAKVTRKRQRAFFREILATLEEKNEPSEDMKIGKTKIKFSGWDRVKQLTAFRSILGSGLSVHMHEGLAELFSEELRFAALEAEARSAEEPKQTAAHYAAAHKLQYQTKAKARETKNKFLQPDE